MIPDAKPAIFIRSRYRMGYHCAAHGRSWVHCNICRAKITGGVTSTLVNADMQLETLPEASVAVIFTAVAPVMSGDPAAGTWFKVIALLKYSYH